MTPNLQRPYSLTFKRLESRRVVKARVVCKIWWKLVDENKNLWRVLELRNRNLEENQSAIDQFDEKSRSTLEEISFEVEIKWEDRHLNFNQLAESILRSKQALRTFILSSRGIDNQASESIVVLVDSLLLNVPNLVDLKRLQSYQRCLWRSNFEDNCDHIWISLSALDIFLSCLLFYPSTCQPSTSLPHLLQWLAEFSKSICQ